MLTLFSRRSHLTKSQPLRLSPPTPPSFPIEFNQLLQATTAMPPPNQAGRTVMIGKHPHGKKGKEGATTKGGNEDTIIEEDEWDLV